MLKAKQKKAIEQFYEKRSLAVLPTGYGKKLAQKLVCLKDIEGGIFDLVHRQKVPQIRDFYIH